MLHLDQKRPSLRSVVGILAVVATMALAWISETKSTADEPAVGERRAETTGTAEKSKPTADPMIGTEAGQVRDDNGLGMKLVWCPPGIFMMGDAGESPAARPIRGRSRRRADFTKAERVILSRGYWFGMYEVTQAEWKQVMATEPWHSQPSTKIGNDYPAIWLTWKKAVEFCRRLTTQEREAGRIPDAWEYSLPTEAQWEHACRARTETEFSFGDDSSQLGEYAWFSENAHEVRQGYAHRIGKKKPNPWGLYDMHGNIDEICRDLYTINLPGGRDPEEVENGLDRVVRGGGWSDQFKNCRSASREGVSPTTISAAIGFRVALVPVRPVNAPVPSAEPAP